MNKPIAFADKIAFETAMASGKGCDVWPSAGDYTQRTGRELIALYGLSEPAPDGCREALAELVAALDKDGVTLDEVRAAHDAARAALSEPAPGAAVPEGWQLVPRVPTQAMIDKAVELRMALGASRISKAIAGYKAMLAAAPLLPPKETKSDFPHL